MATSNGEKRRKDPLAPIIAGHLLGLYMRLVFATSRKQYITPENLRQFMASGQNVIMAGWHNRVFLTPMGYRAQKAPGRTFRPIASASKDGAIAAHAMAHLGSPCVRGSTSRGGAAALRQLVKAVRAGHDLGFTPDGPRGPLHHVHDGVIVCAKMSGAPIVPISYAAARKKRLGSWDRFMVPAPFNRLVIAYGEPVFVARDADSAAMQAAATQLHDELQRLGTLTEAHLQR